MDAPTSPPVTLDDIEAAAERIKARVRRTPCLRTRFIREPVHPNLVLKLECLQVTGSFKARGANNAVLSLDDAALKRGIITASGGNHGIAVAYAGQASGVPTVVYLPERADAAVAAKIERWGGQVIIEGDLWDDAQTAALQHADRNGLTYVHPFADPAVIAGQGTVAREMLKQSPGIDVIVAGIGGGGLISGIALAAKAMKPEITIIGVEPTGAPTLRNSLNAGAVTTLDRVDTKAITLAPRASAALNLGIIRDYVDDIVLVDDAAMQAATSWLFREIGIAADLSGAAALAALHSGAVQVPADATVCAVVCGAGTDGLV